MRNPVYVVIPNFNGKDFIAECLRSLEKQTQPLNVVVVENGSTDSSAEIIESQFPDVTILRQDRNLGFAGGVNVGIRYAVANNAEFVLLLNNDAVARKDWAKILVDALGKRSSVGIAAGKIVSATRPPAIDSTGELYSTWGLAFPRGRNESDIDKYDGKASGSVFGASGGASCYRVKMLKEVGLFDEDFFAYYEDVDLSFRARLAGWDISYVPNAVATHHIGGTAKKLKGFSTYHALKNQPWIIVKNLPLRLWLKIVPRFIFSYIFFLVSATIKGRGWYAIKGAAVSLAYLPKKFFQRIQIQKKKKITAAQLSKLFYKGLPKDYATLYKLVYFYKR